MQRLSIYDSDQLNCQPLADLAVPERLEVIAHTEALAPETADADATIASVFVTSHVTGEVLERMPNLELLIALSSGVDHIDIDEAKRRGIKVVSVPTYGEHTVAEYTFALLLALSRRLPQAWARLRRGSAEQADLVGVDLHGKTIGIIGTGRIGRRVAGIARGFGMEVVAHDPYPHSELDDVEYLELDELLERSEVVSLHCPATEENHHLLDAPMLSRMRPGALLVNTARGELIDHAALIEALRSGRLGGAALDVLEAESLLGHKAEAQALDTRNLSKEARRRIDEHETLLHLPNVIITAHNAYNTAEAQARIMEAGIAAINDHMNDKLT